MMNDKPVFVGRFNIGAVSLHLPMILAKARQDSCGFLRGAGLLSGDDP